MKWREKHLCRTLPVLSTCGVFFTACIIYFIRLMILVEEIQFNMLPDVSIQDFFVNTSGCQIPAWDPWDNSVSIFYDPKGRYKCSDQPSFLRVLPNSVVTLDDAVLRYYYEIGPENISCVFQTIDRNISIIDENTDSRITLSNFKKLTYNKPMAVDFLKTTCNFSNYLYKKVVSIEEFLPLTPLKRDVEYRATHLKEKLKNKPINVILIGLDSVSYLNFLRHFTKCKNFISNISTVFTMKGYTKVGDNTFPNMMPLLTGHFYQHYYDEVKNKTMFFDDVDFIWKLFSRLGYRTLLAEDAPDIATFNYYRSGFLRPPTDYYYRPFALAVENSDLKKNSKPHCFSNKMEMQVIYDYLKSFVDTLGTDRPFFAFVFLARLTHDILNNAGYADEPTYRLLKYLLEAKLFENSMLIFFSDHGIRYGGIRKTYIGQFEERMPFMHVFVPQWLLEKYPVIKQNLITNTKRLTTPFDIHATLLHLASIVSDDKNLEKGSKRGISLFQEVPFNRTCSQASITTHWCPCQKIKLISKADFLVQRAAQTVIDSINNKTANYRRKCALLTLNEVLSARLVHGEEHEVSIPKNSNSKLKNDYLITLSSLPSDAIFEATVECEISKEKKCQVLDDISRINEYGKQSICIDDAELRKFCYCNV